MNELRAGLERWANKRLTKRCEGPFGWYEASVPHTAEDMLGLLWPVIEAAAVEYDMPIRTNINRLGDALAQLKEVIK